MLTRMEITGYRSLHGTELTIRPGVNILVGPNGSGKTNIISFLGFVSDLILKDAHVAVARAGGSTAVFSRETTNTDRSWLTFSVNGEIKPGPRRSHARLVYRYSATVSLDNNNSELYIASELLEYKHADKRRGQTLDLFTDDDEAVLRIEAQRDREERLLNPLIAISGTQRPDRLYYAEGEAPSLADMSKVLTRDMVRNEGPAKSILSQARRYFEDVAHITFDLTRGYTLNVNPSEAKQSDDLARGPGIDPDGRGIAATLQSLQSARSSSRNLAAAGFRPSANFAKVFEDIKAFTRLVNPTIIDLSVETRFDVGKRIAFIELANHPSTLRIPLNSASDGTVKWLALVSALLTRASISALEEPENFLHPSMQREFVGILRTVFEPTNDDFVFVSTHSETVLNECFPSELIIVNADSGKTVACRVDRPDDILEQINETGFGLGFYLSSGALNAS